MAILWWIIVGLVAGWATGKIMGGAGYGFIMDIVVGIIGALIGGFIMSRLGLAASGGMIYTIIVAIFARSSSRSSSASSPAKNPPPDTAGERETRAITMSVGIGA